DYYCSSYASTYTMF
nr:immunoglobulin light chain junction region [Macaca mulatta]MOX41944.1 immunoglobulin light chain junction region [Macaca mulatta]MOX42083.1 immunoglobulin light chain junction region [Macaca mulatta]MOX42761.1 immunoglobulin light chain junction region [Macaca mulatta]MOX43152.1 immunoglobulin light chain junction region [Macaca mulatta]